MLAWATQTTELAELVPYRFQFERAQFLLGATFGGGYLGIVGLFVVGFDGFVLVLFLV